MIKYYDKDDERIVVDGKIDDWYSSNILKDSLDDQKINSNVNIISYSVSKGEIFMYFFVATEERIFTSQNDATLSIFIDSDFDVNTGYYFEGIGAEFMIEITGSRSIITSSFCYMFDSHRSNNDWNGWGTPFTSLHFKAHDLNIIELALPLFDLDQSDNIAVSVHFDDNLGHTDFSDTPAISGSSLIKSSFVPTSTDFIESGYPFATLQIESYFGDSEIGEICLSYISPVSPFSFYDFELVTNMSKPVNGHVIENTVCFSDLSLMIGMNEIKKLEIYSDFSENDVRGHSFYFEIVNIQTESYVPSTNITSQPAYILEEPDRMRIDGVFQDWENALFSNDVIGDVDRESLDIVKFGTSDYEDTYYFYLEVMDDILQGDFILNSGKSSRFQSSTSSSDSTVTYQKNTPLPIKTGEDEIYIFLDIVPSEGYRVAPHFLADYCLHVSGWNGVITSESLNRFSGSSPDDWRWDSIGNIESMAYGNEIELSAKLQDRPMAVHFHIMDWTNGLYDTSMVWNNPQFTDYISSWGASRAQFAVDVGGGLYASDEDGSDWETSDNIATGYDYVDVKSSSDSGSVYVLRNDGKVYFTQNGVDAWYQYGYGQDIIPSSNAYVSLALGQDSNSGYVYVLRSDGKVYFTQNGVDGWAQYGYGSNTVPEGYFVDIAAGSGTNSGYVYILRNDGKVYFTQNGVDGWAQYGYGSSTIPNSKSYVSLDVSSNLNSGYVYVLRNDGKVYFTQNGVDGWSPYGYGSPTIPGSYAYQDVSVDSKGYVYVLRNDGKVYFTQNGVDGWAQYGYGDSSIPSSYSYSGIASGLENNGYVYVLRNNGKVYFTQNGVDGWAQYGYGSILPYSPAVVDVSGHGLYIFALLADGTVKRSTDGGDNWYNYDDAGSDTKWVSIGTNGERVYALGSDGKVVRSSVSSAYWTSWGDVGMDSAWVDIVVTEDYNYVISAEGKVRYSQDSSSTWGNKGDVGVDSNWVSLGVYDDDGYVYAMNNVREVYRASSGSSTSWSSWASATTGSASWVGLTITEDYMFVIRSDGRVDRASMGSSPTWSEEHGDAGDDNAFEAITSSSIPEFSNLLFPIASVLAIVMYNYRRRIYGSVHKDVQKENGSDENET